MIGVVAHDAGGAEIISSYLRRNRQSFVCALEGPAKRVFARKFGEVELLPLDALVARCDWLLCGTSFLSDLEWRALQLAKRLGKRSVIAIDHWANYRQRFLRHGEWCFPDEIWAGDETALRLVQQELPEVMACLQPNAYFLDMQEEIQAIEPRLCARQGGLHVLYVCEPLREDGIALHGNERYWGYTEEEALRYFLANVGALSKSIQRIVVRAHPQEEINKYAWAIDEFALPIVTGENVSLFQQIAECDVVVGCATMAMVVGLLAGKRVLSCIPPGAKTIPLPHAEIENMQFLLAKG